LPAFFTCEINTALSATRTWKENGLWAWIESSAPLATSAKNPETEVCA
jgi:hypothetical protein